MAYFIEKNIPIPKRKRSDLNEALMNMQPGDSILVETTLINALRTFAYSKEKKIITRSEGNNRTRVWLEK